MEEHKSTQSPAVAEAKKRASRSTSAQRAEADGKKARKESRAEEIIHELFRLCHVDLRSSDHLSEMVKELGGIIHKSSPLVLAVVGLRLTFALCAVYSFAAHGVAGLAWCLGSGTVCMAAALDIQSFSVTAPGAGAALAAVTGDPAAVRNAAQGSRILMIGAWSKAQAVGTSQIVFPSGNDTTRNIRWRNVANQPGNMLARGIGQMLEPQDPLTLTQVGSAVAGDVEFVSMMNYYESLPGVDAQLIDIGALNSRMVRLVTVEDTTTATVATTYSGARAINAGSDLLRANTQYAILGVKLGAVCQALTIRGPDTGNLRVAIPGLTAPDVETVNWFVQLSEWFGLPMIPTFNSANKTGTFIENLQDENLTAVPFSLLLAELAAG